VGMKMKKIRSVDSAILNAATLLLQNWVTGCSEKGKQFICGRHAKTK
jgi:hypothetical protein